MNTRLNDFLFRGLMTKHCIKDMQHSGQLRTPLASTIEKAEQDLFSPVSEHLRTSSIEMSRDYRLLFVFENTVREFIDTRFTEEDKTTKWFESRANKDMKEAVETRKKDEDKNQWHVGRNEGELYYLDFSHLSKLITNHWTVFKDFFPGQSWVTTRLEEAKRSRNVIAHTNVLAAEESQRLEMYTRDWIRQIG